MSMFTRRYSCTHRHFLACSHVPCSKIKSCNVLERLHKTLVEGKRITSLNAIHYGVCDMRTTGIELYDMLRGRAERIRRV